MVLNTAEVKDRKVPHLDVERAFTQAVVDEGIYIELPEKRHIRYSSHSVYVKNKHNKFENLCDATCDRQPRTAVSQPRSPGVTTNRDIVLDVSRSRAFAPGPEEVFLLEP